MKSHGLYYQKRLITEELHFLLRGYFSWHKTEKKLSYEVLTQYRLMHIIYANSIEQHGVFWSRCLFFTVLYD